MLLRNIISAALIFAAGSAAYADPFSGTWESGQNSQIHLSALPDDENKYLVVEYSDLNSDSGYTECSYNATKIDDETLKPVYETVKCSKYEKTGDDYKSTAVERPGEFTDYIELKIKRHKLNCEGKNNGSSCVEEYHFADEAVG
jgi:hypothetical protein